MKPKIYAALGIDELLAGRVFILLGIGFFMGLFLATLEVGALTLFLKKYDEVNDLPIALVVGGFFGLVATFIYNKLQNIISFTALGIGSLAVIMILIGFSEFNVIWQETSEELYFYLFTFIVPFTFLLTLVFWGSFGRLFTLKQSKSIIGNIDTGTLVATIIGFFSIPIILNFLPVERLFLISLGSIAGMMVLFIIMSRLYLRKSKDSKQVKEEVSHEQLPYVRFFKNRYIVIMCGFALISVIGIQFIDYAFLNVTTIQFDEDQIAEFLALFEGTIVIFSFLFQTFITDRLIAQFGLKVSLLVTPVVGGIFVAIAFLLGSFFGYTIESDTIIFFFLAVAMSKLLLSSLKDALDQPTFKLYFLPVDSEYRFDVQTKVEGVFTAFANLVGGAIILLFTKVDFIDLIYIVLLAIPIILVWYWLVGKMHVLYKTTLQGTLVKNKEKASVNISKEYALDKVLEKEVNSDAEDKVIYGLKLMQRLEPALCESVLLKLAESPSQKIKQYAREKIQELNIETSDGTDQSIRELARQAQAEVEDSDLLSISPEKLMKLSKSVRKSDRMFAAKLLRKLISHKNIFVLLELLRDIDPAVRKEALITARKVKRPETWSVLIELLSSPSYSHQAISALKEAGEAALPTLESAFHKSGQSNLVMLKIVQIMGHIGGKNGMQLLWKKIDYPDKRIVRQIVYSLRYFNYRAKGSERTHIISLLEAEVGKAIWNLAALTEIPNEEIFQYLREALKEEVAENFDQITILMSILYDPESVQLVRDNVESGTSDGVAFALELLDIFLDEELKPKLVPLFDDISIEKKVEQLQIYFPRESYNPIQVINYIINRDFNQSNRWTKACALHAAAFIPDFRINRGLIGQMFNQDKLLKEVAAWVVYNKDKSTYNTIAERLTLQERRFLDVSLQNNQLLEGLDDGFFLWVEMVMFIKGLPLFKGIHGSLLSDMSDKIKPVILKGKEKISFDPKDENSPLFIVAHGDAKLYYDEELKSELNVGDIIGDIKNEAAPVIGNKIITNNRCVLFQVDLLDFYFVLANHHELTQGLIRNVTKEPAMVIK
jgi:ATP:ADP antiporter, AAA family